MSSLQHEERAFVLKFSAIEIYNEAIRDLLSSDDTQLRLRDDPEVNTNILISFIYQVYGCSNKLFSSERNHCGKSHRGTAEGLEPFERTPCNL